MICPLFLWLKGVVVLYGSETAKCMFVRDRSSSLSANLRYLWTNDVSSIFAFYFMLFLAFMSAQRFKLLRTEALRQPYIVLLYTVEPIYFCYIGCVCRCLYPRVIFVYVSKKTLLELIMFLKRLWNFVFPNRAETYRRPNLSVTTREEIRWKRRRKFPIKWRVYALF